MGVPLPSLCSRQPALPACAALRPCVRRGGGRRRCKQPQAPRTEELPGCLHAHARAHAGVLDQLNHERRTPLELLRHLQATPGSAPPNADAMEQVLMQAAASAAAGGGGGGGKGAAGGERAVHNVPPAIASGGDVAGAAAPEAGQHSPRASVAPPSGAAADAATRAGGPVGFGMGRGRVVEGAGAAPRSPGAP